MQVIEDEDDQDQLPAPVFNPQGPQPPQGAQGTPVQPQGGQQLGGVAPAPGTAQGNLAPTRTGKRSRRAGEEQDREAAARARKAPAALFDELNWDYAVVERLNLQDLSTQVIPFNLGRAVLQHDRSQDIELQPGDVVTVYSQKDIRVPVARQTRLVSLEGEVAAPGVYQLQAGDTLRSLIDRAGGFTPQAYVYGLEFSREETRQRQRENLNAAMTRLQALSATQSARDAANRRDDASDRSATVSNAATQAQLARLAQLQPNGRIALELQPDARTLDALPEVPWPVRWSTATPSSGSRDAPPVTTCAWPAWTRRRTCPTCSCCAPTAP